MAADVAGARGAEDRVGHGVTHRVGIRMSGEAAFEGNRHTAKDQRPPFDKAMKIVAHPRSSGPRRLASTADGLGHDVFLQASSP